MDEKTPEQPVEEPLAPAPPPPPPPAPHPSEPLPPHPAFATVMKTHHSRQQIGIAVFVVILILGIFGTYAWQHQKISTLTAQKLSADQAVDRLNNQIVPLEANAAKSVATTDTANQNVFKIPELGIQLSVPASLKTLTYYYVSSAAGKTVDLSTTTLANVSSTCAETTTENTANGAALGSLFKGTGTGKASLGTTIVKQFSGYYIAYLQPQASCAAANTSVSAIITEETADLKASFSTIQSLP